MDQEEKQLNYERAEKLYGEQNLGAALVSGTITMILGSGLYAVAALAAGGPSISVLIIGIGAAIGLAMQFLGRGIDTKFAVAASVLAMISYPVAKLFTIALYTAKVEQLSAMELLTGKQIGAMWGWFLSGVRLLDLIFLVAAIGTASFLSKRRLSREEGLAIHTYERR